MRVCACARSCVHVLSQLFVRGLHGLGGEAHVLQHFRVGVGVLERLPLELDGGQRAVDLLQLLAVAFFPLQGLQCRCGDRKVKGESK